MHFFSSVRSCATSTSMSAQHILHEQMLLNETASTMKPSKIHLEYILFLFHPLCVRMFIFSEENILVHETEEWGGDGDDDDVMWCDVIQVVATSEKFKLKKVRDDENIVIRMNLLL